MMSKNHAVPQQMADDEDFLDYAMSHGFGDLHFKVDKESGLRAIIAIHNTRLGPALGGCRFIHYDSLHSAITDAMRLARGMSYKAASVNLPLGGGKSVIIKPKGQFDRQAMMHAFGRFVNELNGRYITALDSGTELSDMDIIGHHTRYVASKSEQQGDPSPYTAKGVLLGIEEAVRFKLDKHSLNGLHVAIQGLGHVGFLLARMLHEQGAHLTVADISTHACEEAQKQFGAKVVHTSDIHLVECDVFSPCALGGIINDKTIHELNTTIIAGAANNQLAHSYHGAMLKDAGILYVPDYVINAGGLIYAKNRYFHEDEHQAEEGLMHIPEGLREIFERSDRDNLPTSDIADKRAQEKLS